MKSNYVIVFAILIKGSNRNLFIESSRLSLESLAGGDACGTINAMSSSTRRGQCMHYARTNKRRKVMKTMGLVFDETITD